MTPLATMSYHGPRRESVHPPAMLCPAGAIGVIETLYMKKR
eukprot:CAMPEP_0203887854 /NCGR_PEP_ID=MMETSP0359-20131031/31526_1 /ASSEMBLY_ACC=CAM_ASM_000338 /TAXON_ID=268821 /ORGANISM="Scrippsiella Hangoei, Strain SHTV-5" /LENGTH=40 /DNA_ID= /DNA_START= /DNA_END= /DNA_ORIENTATION=